MIHILVVDDEPSIRETLGGILEDEGYHVTLVENGETCLTLLGDQQAQLAVQQNRLLASVALFQDLGGGFQASDLPSTEAIQAKLPFAP